MQSNNNCAGIVKVRCVTEGCTQADFIVTVTNSCDEVVYKGRTDAQGYVRFSVNEKDEYQIKVKNLNELDFTPGYAYRWLNLSPDKDCGVYFMFTAICNAQTQPQAQTFTLTDRNYPGLPIQTGELTLWQNLMQ